MTPDWRKRGVSLPSYQRLVDFGHSAGSVTKGGDEILATQEG